MRLNGVGLGVGLMAVGAGLFVVGCSPATAERTVVVTTTAVRTATTTVTVPTAGPESPQIPTGEVFLDRQVFDSGKLDAGVLGVLTQAPPAGFGLTGVSDVSCPAGQPVEVGSTFGCSLTVEGRSTTVTVQVLSSDGQYRVNPPD